MDRWRREGDEDNEEEHDEEYDPMAPVVLPPDDYEADSAALTNAEEKALSKLRRQRSDYSNNGEEEERADMLSNEDSPEADGMATTSFMEKPEIKEPRRRIYYPDRYIPQGAAPIAPIEDEIHPLPEKDETHPVPEKDDIFPVPEEEKKEPERKEVYHSPPAAQPSPEMIELHNIELHDMEGTGPPEEEEEEAFECTSLGWFNCCGTICVRVHRQLCTAHSTMSCSKRILGILGLVILASLTLFVGIFSASFEYINYYEIALKQSRMTGVVNRETVLYPGCYVLGPDVDLVLFDSTAHTLSSRVSVFTSDKLVIDIDVSLQYFLRPEEVGKLHAKFGLNYHDTVESLLLNAIKNEGSKHSLDVYRLSRAQVEKALFQSVRERLGGNCCPSCCPRRCDNNTVCSLCQPPASCDQAYHINVDYFQLGKVKIPDEIFERLLKKNILLINFEREAHIQEHALVVKKTEREAGLIVNEAKEIKANATAYGENIGLVAKAQRQAVVEISYIRALKNMFSRMNVTNEEHKKSIMMMMAFDDIKDNLYGYGYENNKLGTT